MIVAVVRLVIRYRQPLFEVAPPPSPKIVLPLGNDDRSFDEGCPDCKEDNVHWQLAGTGTNKTSSILINCHDSR